MAAVGREGFVHFWHCAEAFADADAEQLQPSVRKVALMAAYMQGLELCARYLAVHADRGTALVAWINRELYDGTDRPDPARIQDDLVKIGGAVSRAGN